MEAYGDQSIAVLPFVNVNSVSFGADAHNLIQPSLASSAGPSSQAPLFPTMAIDTVVLDASFGVPSFSHRTSDSTTMSRDPGLRTLDRHVRRSPFAARSRLILNSTVRTM